MPRRAWLLLAVVAVAVFLFILDRQLVALLKTTLRLELGWSDSEFAWIFSAFAISHPVGLIMSGWMIQRFGPQRVSLWSLLLMSAATVASGMVQELWQMLIARTILGLAEGGVIVAAIITITRWFPARRRATALSVKTFMASFAYIGGPWIAAETTDALNWRFAFFIPGAIGLFVPWFWQRLDRNAPIYAGESSGPNKVAVRQLLTNKAVWGIVLARAIGDPLWLLYINWQPGYLQDHLGLTLQGLGTWAWWPPALASVFALLGGIVSDRLASKENQTGRSRIVVIQAVALLGLTAWILPFTENLWATVIVFAAIHVLFAQWGNLTEALLADTLARPQVGPALGLIGLMMGLSATGSNFVIGVMVEQRGYGPLFMIAGTLPLAAAMLLHFWFRTRPTAP